MAERKSLAEWGFIVTVLLGGVFLAFSGVVAKVAGWLLILLAFGLTLYWWSDLRKLWSRGPEPEGPRGDIEVTPKKIEDEEGIGFMPAYTSTSVLAIPGRTTLIGYISVEVVNHSSTAATKIFGMRLALFDPNTGSEIAPSEPTEFEVNPKEEEHRLVQPLGRRVFGFHPVVTFAGQLNRENAPGRVFLMVKVAGIRDELKVPLGQDFFLPPSQWVGRHRRGSEGKRDGGSN